MSSTPDRAELERRTQKLKEALTATTRQFLRFKYRARQTGSIEDAKQAEAHAGAIRQIESQIDALKQQLPDLD